MRIAHDWLTNVAPQPAASASRDASGQSRSSPSLPTDRFQLTAPIVDSGPDAASGTNSSDNTSNGGSTTQTYITLTPGAGAVSKGSSAPVTSASITFTIVRGTDLPTSTGVDRFTANMNIDTPNGTVTATATGEALFVGGVWKMRGRSTVVGGSWNFAAGSGGFVADLDTAGSTTMTDDSIAWRLDAVQTG